MCVQHLDVQEMRSIRKLPSLPAVSAQLVEINTDSIINPKAIPKNDSHWDKSVSRSELFLKGNVYRTPHTHTV